MMLLQYQRGRTEGTHTVCVGEEGGDTLKKLEVLLLLHVNRVVLSLSFLPTHQ